MEYQAGHFGYPMYEAAYEISNDHKTTVVASTSWLEFDKSPDTEKTLLEDSKTPSIEKDISENVIWI